MNQQLAEKVEGIFINNFGRKPQSLIFSPGRINLIGEHVDYNGGVVLPASIDKAIYIALSPSDNDKSTIYALDLDEKLEIDSYDFQKSSTTWHNYLLGILNELKVFNGFNSSFNAVFSGDIPIGAGLSSSAALDCGFLFGLNSMYELKIPLKEQALMAQRAEHNFVGVNSGIMDQFANLHGKENHFIYLDTRNLEYSYFEVDLGEYAFQLYNSNVSHELANSAYNSRRKSCEMIVEELQKLQPTISSLRDCSHELLYTLKEHVPHDDYIKSKFVIGEMLRVNATTEALKSNDIETVGELLNETHQGLRDDYEVSCKEVDFLQNEALKHEAVLGSRIMGGGFGGCTLNLIRKDSIAEVSQILKEKYKTKYKKELTPISVQIFNGTYCIY